MNLNNLMSPINWMRDIDRKIAIAIAMTWALAIGSLNAADTGRQIDLQALLTEVNTQSATVLKPAITSMNDANKSLVDAIQKRDTTALQAAFDKEKGARQEAIRALGSIEGQLRDAGVSVSGARDDARRQAAEFQRSGEAPGNIPPALAHDLIERRNQMNATKDPDLRAQLMSDIELQLALHDVDVQLASFDKEMGAQGGLAGTLGSIRQSLQESANEIIRVSYLLKAWDKRAGLFEKAIRGGLDMEKAIELMNDPNGPLAAADGLAANLSSEMAMLSKAVKDGQERLTKALNERRAKTGRPPVEDREEAINKRLNAIQAGN